MRLRFSDGQELVIRSFQVIGTDEFSAASYYFILEDGREAHAYMPIDGPSLWVVAVGLAKEREIILRSTTATGFEVLP